MAFDAVKGGEAQSKKEMKTMIIIMIISNIPSKENYNSKLFVCSTLIKQLQLQVKKYLQEHIQIKIIIRWQ